MLQDLSWGGSSALRNPSSGIPLHQRQQLQCQGLTILTFTPQMLQGFSSEGSDLTLTCPLWLCFPLWVGTEQSSIQSCTSSNVISQSLLQCQPVNGWNKLKMKFWYKQRNFSSTELCVHPSCRQMFITPPKGSQLSLFLIVFKLFRGVLNFTGEESIRSLVLLFPLENE